MKAANAANAGDAAPVAAVNAYAEFSADVVNEAHAAKAAVSAARPELRGRHAQVSSLSWPTQQQSLLRWVWLDDRKRSLRARSGKALTDHEKLTLHRILP